MNDKLVEHRQYIKDNGVDLPEAVSYTHLGPGWLRVSEPYVHGGTLRPGPGRGLDGSGLLNHIPMGLPSAPALEGAWTALGL